MPIETYGAAAVILVGLGGASRWIVKTINRRFEVIEERQRDLREKDLPQNYIALSVFNQFDERITRHMNLVESFIEMCRDGKCAALRPGPRESQERS